ncbi:methyltransferase [Burkholderia gladioli]|uniref:O-methyltransferase n=1 Tax=Burkholderia gladioli (strain BSR3) TaxID=999541 RepID=F2LRQ8_BURGS|nr:methyltransferase [Burkholderia gladioli]AEA65552.1 O-methyltransferase [Burkholderia gladioli BSR3]MBW5286679.1 O-methyltransferase [Burkholderia gladioli]
MLQDDVRQLRQWIYGYQIAQSIHVVARLGIPDLLAREALDCAELARRAGCDADALRRLLRALETLGLFRQDGEDRYVHTGMSRLLIGGEPGSQDFAACIYGDEHYRAWSELYASVKSGTPRFDALYGTDYFSYLERQGQSNAKLGGYLAHDAAMRLDALLAAHDFAATRHLVEIGGDGRIATALLARFPALRVTLAGPPPLTASGADGADSGADPAPDARLRLAPGELGAVPPGDGDVYLLSQILHRLDAAAAVALLAACRAAMRDGAVLLIQEYPVPESGSLAPGRWMDLNMMVVCGGRERTLREYEALIDAAGLKLVTHREGAGQSAVLACVAAPADPIR